MKLLTALIRLLSHVPLRILYVVSDVMLFPLLYSLVRYRRKVVRRNLLRSFPGKSIQEVRRIERRFYRFFGDVLMETLRQYSMPEDEMRRRVVFHNDEIIQEFLKKGRTVMLMTGHYCNWEWSFSYHLHTPPNVAVCAVYQQLNNRHFDQFMLALRSRMGGHLIEKNDLLRTMHRHRTDAVTAVYGMISDQSPQRQFIRYRLNFLNQETPVFLGTEQLARKYDYPVFYIDIQRIKRGVYQCNAVPVELEPSKSAEFAITNRFMQLLETSIHRQPEYWLWSHNRWKHSNTFNN
jgi:KDO2-lipid IV(A) lauroyltransferase